MPCVHRFSNKDSAPSWIIENGDGVEVTGACCLRVHDQQTAVALAHASLTRSVRHVTLITPCHVTFTGWQLSPQYRTVHVGTCMLHVIIGYNRGYTLSNTAIDVSLPTIELCCAGPQLLTSLSYDGLGVLTRTSMVLIRAYFGFFNTLQDLL